MAEAMLGQDEVESIAKEYAQRRENVSDVEIESGKPMLMDRVLIHIVKGKARKQAVDSTNKVYVGVEVERSFTLYICDENKKVTGYEKSDWTIKSAGGPESISTPPYIPRAPEESFKSAMDNVESMDRIIRQNERILREIKEDFKDKRRR